jgi:hypothetical protein
MINNLWYTFVEVIRENIKKDVKLWTFIWEDQIGKHCSVEKNIVFFWSMVLAATVARL